MTLIATIAFILAATAATVPKNVILLIADGTGIAHWTSAQQVRGEKFRIGTMPVTGLVTTSCLNRAVTDSAASASAYATGFKTNYEMISVEPQTLLPQTTVLEKAERRGKATGLVTTTYFWDATPAAFAAHAKHRDDPTIPAQMLASGAEVIAGTGLEDFQEITPELEAEAKKNGYAVITSRAQLDTVKGGKMLAMFRWQERNMDFPQAPLPVLAQWALDRLDDDPKGFFLLVEHEGTDSASHQNHTRDVRNALASFDEAVGIALDFAAKRGDTLVIVTGDHETGGLRVSETKAARFRMEWSTTDHTGTAVPIFAFGPGSAAFAGLQDNTDVGKKLSAAVLATR